MIFTKKEAAEFLRCSPITIDRARKAGRLPCRKIGARVVFTQADIDAFLESCKVSVAEQSSSKTNGGKDD